MTTIIDNATGTTSDVTKYNIAELETNVNSFFSSSNEISNRINESISMLQLDSVQESIAESVVQIEQLSNKPEKSFAAKIPFLGKYWEKAAEKTAEENLKSGGMTETVDRLFGALSSKRENILSVMENLFQLKEQLEVEVGTLGEQHEIAEYISANGSGMEQVKARNLLVQIKEASVKTRDRVQILGATIQAAEASTVRISAMLPQLQSDLVTELGIQAGLQELKEFKQVFDATVDVVKEVQGENHTGVQDVMLDLVDLAVNQGTSVAQLENFEKQRQDFSEKIKTKMDKAYAEQTKSLQKLTDIQASGNMLTFTPTAAQGDQ